MIRERALMLRYTYKSVLFVIFHKLLLLLLLLLLLWLLLFNSFL